MAENKVKGAYIDPRTKEYLEILKGVQPGGRYHLGGHGTFLPVEKIVKDENLLTGRKADLKNKNKNGVETLDSKYDKETIRPLLNAYKDAAALHGIKMMDPDDFLIMALNEGRSNFGYNDYNYNNARTNKIVKTLIDKGYDPYAAGFPAAIVDKQMEAKRLNLPFFHLWNGAGPAARAYNQRHEDSRYSVEDPRNQNLRNFIRESMGQKPIGKVSEADIPDTEYPTIVAADTPLEAPLEAPIEIRKGGMVKMPQSN